MNFIFRDLSNLKREFEYQGIDYIFENYNDNNDIDINEKIWKMSCEISELFSIDCEFQKALHYNNMKQIEEIQMRQLKSISKCLDIINEIGGNNNEFYGCRNKRIFKGIY